ncbi:MAG: CHAD domain-containing protein, partial [Sinomonas sp.]|nr:CHAD domain-containing protein [Sinomonas sp.]
EHPSKLARTLGASYPQGAVPPPRPRRKGPAAAVVLAYLRENAEKLKAMDRGVREDEPDAVHQLRVSARRMRSAIATYLKLLDRSSADHLRSELQWAANAVGEARDIEVMRQRLEDLVAAEPDDLLLGPVAQRIEEELGARYREARTSGLAALNDQRYFRLLDALDALLASPPLTDAAQRKAGKATARLVSRDLKRLRTAVDAAQAARGHTGEGEALHEARKKAKRMRYAAEAAKTVHGKRARRLAKGAAKIQQTLGDHQDSVVTREMLRNLASTTLPEGTTAFTFGRLHAQEEQQGAADRAEFFRLWAEFQPKRLR